MVLKEFNNFQNIFTKLCNFWNDFGCVVIPPAQTEISSPLFHPTIFFGMIRDSDIDMMYFQPHVASKESNNISFDTQNYTFLKFQVVVKSEVINPQKLILDSLEYIGFDLKGEDLRFSNENYENFIFRINAYGYRILFNNISIAKLHYVQSVGTHNFDSIPLVIMYDLDKILMVLQNITNLCNTFWNYKNGKQVLYSDLTPMFENENYEFIKDTSTNEIILQQFNNFGSMASNLLKEKIIIPAFISILKAKYCLDILNMRNYIMYNDKLNHNKALRTLVDLCCSEYLLKIKKDSK
jgi:glycyl-tRNA synthetase alpha chain